MRVATPSRMASGPSGEQPVMRPPVPGGGGRAADIDQMLSAIPANAMPSAAAAVPVEGAAVSKPGYVNIGGVDIPMSPEPRAPLPDPNKALDPSQFEGDPWKSLLQFGLGMMAAGSKPGATLLGAAGGAAWPP